MAATLTIDIPTNDVPRVSKSFGLLYQLGHDANMNEVAYYTRMWIINQTKLAENSQYNRNYVEQPLEMQPTPTPTPTGTPGLRSIVQPVTTPPATATVKPKK